MADTPELRKFRRSMQRLDVASLKELIERRHPEYDARLAHWNFLEATFEGGREWFASNIFKYVKEGTPHHRRPDGDGIREVVRLRAPLDLR